MENMDSKTTQNQCNCNLWRLFFVLLVIMLVSIFAGTKFFEYKIAEIKIEAEKHAATEQTKREQIMADLARKVQN